MNIEFKKGDRVRIAAGFLRSFEAEVLDTEDTYVKVIRNGPRARPRWVHRKFVMKNRAQQ